MSLTHSIIDEIISKNENNSLKIEETPESIEKEIASLALLFAVLNRNLELKCRFEQNLLNTFYIHHFAYKPCYENVTTAADLESHSTRQEEVLLGTSEQKNETAIQLLRSWREGDEQEQRDTWEYLKQALDENRLSDRKLFG